MYRCSNCGTTMSQPLDRCPSCRALLSGVRCEACRYVGGKSEFINNNHRCPKCNSKVYVPGVPRPSTPSKPSKPYVPGIGAAILGVILSLINIFFVFLCFLSLPLCIYVVLRAKERTHKIVESVGIGLSVLPLIFMLDSRA